VKIFKKLVLEYKWQVTVHNVTILELVSNPCFSEWESKIALGIKIWGIRYKVIDPNNGTFKDQE